jgi:hypothetical protein
MINGGTVLKWSTAFAKRIEEEVPGGQDSQVRHAYRLAFGRDPNEDELSRAVEFLSSTDGEEPAGTLADLCHVLLNANEFLYVD